MKRLIVAVMLIVGTAFSVLGQEQKAKLTTCPAGWTAGPDADWKIFWNDALAEARLSGKKIFVLSTGSDWCGWCMKLKKDVFEKDEFKDYARKNLVLLYLDSPRKPLPEDQKQHNDAICGTLSFGGGVPCAAVFGVDSRRYGVISGYSKTPAEYIARIDEVLAKEGEMPKSGQPPRIFTEGYAVKKVQTECGEKPARDSRISSQMSWFSPDYKSNTVNGVTWYYYISNGVAVVEAPIRIVGPARAEIRGSAIPVSTGGTVIVPALLGGCQVGRIGEQALYCCKNVTSVVVPSSVTSIGEKAFYDCRSLSEVALPDAVLSIEQGAFYGCTNLVSVTVPAGLTHIGGEAFMCCCRLSGFAIPINCVSIGDRAFFRCDALAEMRIPAGVRKIGDRAFSGLRAFAVDEQNPTFRHIGTGLYDKEGSRLLAYPCLGGVVRIPETVTNISDSACEDLGSAKSIAIDPENRFYMSFEGCLYDRDMTVLVRCPNVSRLMIPEGVRCISAHAFNCLTGLVNVSISSSVVEIERCAFNACSGLESVTIPESVTNIGDMAFAGCRALKSITIPSSVKAIRQHAFSGCCGLKSVILMSGVESIGLQAFSNCPQLESVRIPSSVRMIGRNSKTQKELLGATTFEGGNLSSEMGEELKIVVDTGDEERVQEMLYQKSLYTERIRQNYERRRRSIESRGGRWRTIKVVAEKLPVRNGESPMRGQASTIFTNGDGRLVFDRDDEKKKTQGKLKKAAAEVQSKKLAEGDFQREIEHKDEKSGPTVGAKKSEHTDSVGPIRVAVGENADEVRSCEFSSESQVQMTTNEVSFNDVGWQPGPSDDWFVNWEKAAAESKMSGKPIYVVKSKDKDKFYYYVLKHPEFVKFACAHMVLLYLSDERNSSLCEQQKNHIRWASEKLSLGESVPSAVVVTAEGKRIGQIFGDHDCVIDDYRYRIRDILGLDGDGHYTPYSKWTDPKTGITWRYRTSKQKDGTPCACLGDNSSKLSVVDRLLAGDLEVPEFIDGKPVVEIWDSAFAYCVNLTSIHVPRSVSKITGDAFWGCCSLTNIIIHSENRCFRSENGFVLDKEGRMVVAACGGRTTIEIPPSVKSIGYEAFAGCYWLENVRIHPNVCEIGGWAFVGCAGLVKRFRLPGAGYMIVDGWVVQTAHIVTNRLVFPVGVRGIANWSFSDDNADIREVVFPEGLLFIGEDSFCGCGLTGIDLPASLRKVGGRSFRCDQRSGHQRPMGVKFAREIGSVVLRSNDALFAMPDAVTNVVLIKGVERVRDRCFCDRRALKRVVLPEGLSEIGTKAFSGCCSLESVSIPEGVTRIEDKAFEGCCRLKSIVLPKSVKEVARTAFDGCIGLRSIAVAKGNAVFRQVDDFVFKGDELYFAVCHGKKDIRIPDGVKRIGAGQFRGCDGIESVELPKCLEEVDEEAFMGCVGIRHLRLPESLRKIGSRAFSDCTSMSVELPSRLEALGDCAFQNCSGIRRLRIPASLKRIGWQTFKDCKSLLAVEMEDGVSRVGKGAFAGCSLLANIRIPKSVVEIGDDAFAGCDQLLRKDEMTVVDGCVLKADGMCPSDLVLTEDIRLIADASFKSHREITSIAASRNLKHVGDGAFEGCADLTRIVLPGVEARGAVRAFRRCTKLSEATFFAERAEEWCYFAPKGNGSKGHPYESLTNLVIAEGSEVIGYREFMSCTNLVSLRIPSSVTNIESMAFSMCGRLGQGVVIVNGCVLGVNGAAPDELVLPEGVRLIADSAFQNCSNIVSVALPSSVRHVGALAFAGCGRLERISVAEGNPVFHCSDGLLIKGCEIVCGIARGRVCIPNGVERIGRYAFSSNKEVTSLEIADTVREIGKSAFSGCSKLTSVRCGNGLRSIGEWAFNCCKALETINLPSTLSNMARGAFNGCSSLRAVALPDDLVNVANSLFWGCAALEEVRLPSGATNISGTVFRDCTALRSVSIPPQVRAVGHDAFAGCASLKAIDVPAGVETIGFRAFYGCAFESLALPEGVRYIEGEAFRNCTNLTSCTLPASVEKIGWDAFGRCDMLKEIRVAHGDAQRVLSLDVNSRPPYALGGRYEANGDLLVQRPNWKPRKPSKVTPSRGVHSGGVKRCWPGGDGVNNGTTTNRQQQGLLGTRGSQRARRMQRQRAAQEAALKQRTDAVARAAERQPRADEEKSQREAERAEQRRQLLAIQEEMKRVRAKKAPSASDGVVK